MHDSAKRGMYTYPILPLDALCQRLVSAPAASSDARVVSTKVGGTPSPESIMACPKRARMPLRTSSSATMSPNFVVPISRIVVVPVIRRSSRPSRTLARTDASSCAASSGHTRARSHWRSGISSARPRKSVWTRWMWVWTSPGMTTHPEISMTSVSGGGVTWPRPPMRVPLTRRSPHIGRGLSFSGSNVPPRRRRLTSDTRARGARSRARASRARHRQQWSPRRDSAIALRCSEQRACRRSPRP